MPEAAVALPLANIRVLVVEDDPDTLELHAMTLRSAGARVVEAKSGAEALTLLGRHVFDALVSDIALPDLDGFELMRKVREHDGPNAGVPALAVTGLGEEEHIGRAVMVGYHAHVKKPLAPRDLVVAVTFLVSGPRR